jgi:Holliday junction DNA helicase RuvA
MISRIEGTWCAAPFGPAALVDASGVGWAVEPVDVGHVDGPVELWVHAVYRDGEPKLFGFADSAARDLFVRLLNVPGVGAATAAEILRTVGPSGLVAAISAKDHVTVSTARGVGAKTAKRVVDDVTIPADLAAELGAVEPQGAPSTDDLVDALVGMGWPQQSAAAAVTAARRRHDSDAEILGAAMSELSAGGVSP